MNNLNVKKSKEFFFNSLKNKTYQLYYYLSISLILILIFIIFIIYPLTSNIFQELNSVNIINTENTQMQQRYNSITSSYNIYEKNIVSNIKYLNTSLPNSKNTAFVFGNLYQIMSNNNISLSSINFNASVGNLSPSITSLSNSFSISISAQGSYQSLISFLDTISNYPQRIIVYNISFTPDLISTEQAVPTNNLFSTQGSISFNALVFYYSPKS